MWIRFFCFTDSAVELTRKTFICWLHRCCITTNVEKSKQKKSVHHILHWKSRTKTKINGKKSKIIRNRNEVLLSLTETAIREYISILFCSVYAQNQALAVLFAVVFFHMFFCFICFFLFITFFFLLIFSSYQWVYVDGRKMHTACLQIIIDTIRFFITFLWSMQDGFLF